MGKQAAKNGGRDSGKGEKGGANKNNKTVDAAALGLGGTPPAPLANTSLLQPMANPSGVVPGLDPNMMSMLAMAQAFNGGGQQQGQTLNVAFSQAQLLQVMQAVQANNAAQKAAEAAASKKTLEDAVAAATAEKDARIAALEGKKQKARKAADDDDDEESDEEADEEDEEPLKLVSRNHFIRDRLP